jgi:hypothetical protein
LAIQRTLQLWVTEGAVIGQPLVQTTLWWLTDNQNVEKMLEKGSGKLRIMKLVLDILKIGRLLLLDLQTIWVSRNNHFLLKADAISKGIDTDSWEITGDNIAHLSALFGPFTVDLFATKQNAKCERFYSRSWEEGSAGVDAFAWDWAGESVYAAPLVTLVLWMIRKAAASACSGVLIIPLWMNAMFWTFCFRDWAHLNSKFESVQIVRMHTMSWELSNKDLIGGKEMQFLVFKIGVERGVQALELLPRRGRFFKHLFGRDCKVCVASV